MNTQTRATREQRFARPAVVATAVGALVCVLGAIIDPRRTAAAYLTAYAAVLTVVLGALCMVMISHLTGATWFVLLRRRAEGVVATLPLFAVLLIPVLLSVRALYPWATPERIADRVLLGRVVAKAGYLSVPFFVLRSIVYVGAWIIVGELLRRWSVQQDATGEPTLTYRMRALSAGGSIVVGLTLTFAAFDWLMSLSPAWYSTVYGLYVFAGGMVGALAVSTLVAWRDQALARAPIRDDHFHALGKLQLTFVLFWAYMGYAQLIVIWSANIPVEASWYVARVAGGWKLVDALLILGGFGVPFVALLLWPVKRSSRLMAVLASWLLLMHYIDVYWLVLPSVGGDVAPGLWIDAAAVLFIVGIAAMYGMWRARSVSSLARHDPALEQSIRYRTG